MIRSQASPTGWSFAAARLPSPLTELEDAMKGSLAQQITPALRKWIVEQARAGHRPEAVLEAMKASGWREDVALDALETVLSSALREQALASPQSPASAPATAVSTSLRLPEPLLDGAPASVWAHDREVRIVMSMRDPRVVVFAELLSDDECDEIVALARERLARSHTVDTTTGDSEVNAARTSEGMFFARGEHPVCARLEARIAALVNWPLENG
jgi:prolyl 4-hydroxylase